MSKWVKHEYKNDITYIDCSTVGCLSFNDNYIDTDGTVYLNIHGCAGSWNSLSFANSKQRQKMIEYIIGDAFTEPLETE